MGYADIERFNLRHVPIPSTDQPLNQSSPEQKALWPWMLVAAGFFSLILLLWHPIDFIPLRVLLFILAFFTIQFTTVFLHELGHLIVAILFRLLPATLVIGSGAQLAEFKIGEIGFRLCSSTNEGRVIPSYANCRPSKFLLVALFAAGPIADIIVLFILAKLAFFPHNSLAEHSLFESQIRPLLSIAVIYIFYYQLIYLLDRKSYTDGNYTDARGIADALTFFPAPPPVEEATQRLYKQFFNCEVFVPEPLPTDSEDLQTYTQWALSLPRTTPQQARDLKDMFITATILYGWTANLPLANVFSSDLLAANPDVITYKGSRGAVLIHLDKFEEGKSLLQEVFSKSKSDVDRVISAAFIAIAEHRLGNIAAAQDWLGHALTIDPSSLAVERAHCIISP